MKAQKSIVAFLFITLVSATSLAQLSNRAIEFQPAVQDDNQNRNIIFTMADGIRVANGSWANVNGRVVFVTVYHAAENCKENPISIDGIKSIDCIVPAPRSSNAQDLVFVIFPSEITPKYAPSIARNKLNVGEVVYIHHQDGISKETVEAYVPGVDNGEYIFVATTNLEANLIQGDSGSPLFTASGELVGVLRGVAQVRMENGSAPMLTGFSSLHSGSPLADKLITDLLSHNTSGSIAQANRYMSDQSRNRQSSLTKLPEGITPEWVEKNKIRTINISPSLLARIESNLQSSDNSKSYSDAPNSRSGRYKTYTCSQTCRLSLYNQYDLEMSDYYERTGIADSDPSIYRSIYPKNETSVFTKSYEEAVTEAAEKLKANCDSYVGRSRGGNKVKAATLQGELVCN